MPYNWSHSIVSGIFGYYPQHSVRVHWITQYNAAEDSVWDFEWGATWLIDSTNNMNSQAYIEPLGRSFTAVIPTFYPEHDLGYNNAGYFALIEPQWGDAGSPTCQARSYMVIHGPNN